MAARSEPRGRGQQRGEQPPGGHQPGGHQPGGHQRGGRPRRTDPARRAAYDVLIAVEQRDAYANLLLPSVLARARSGRPGRRADHRAHLRHAARPRHLRRDPQRVQRPEPGPDRPAAARSAPARHPPAAGYPGSLTRRRGHLRRPGPGAGWPALGRLRQRGAAPGGHPGPGDLDRGGRAVPGHRSARPPRGPVQPPPVAGGRGGRCARRGSQRRAGRDRGRAGRGRHPATGHAVRRARAGRPGRTARRRSGTGAVVGVRRLSRSAGTRARSRRYSRSARRSRTRPASWPRSRSPGWS